MNTYKGLKIGRFASSNAIHFEALANHFSNHCKSLLINCSSLFKWIRQKTFFFIFTPFLDKIFFLTTFMYKVQKYK